MSHRSSLAGAEMGARAARCEKFIARQPIYNRRRQAYGYELLFRSGARKTFDGMDPDLATYNVVSDSLLLHGVERLANRQRMFVNFSRESLLGEVPSFLPPDRVVIEILETVAPDDQVLSACRRLKKAGYCLALDDVADYERAMPFLGLVQCIKVDVQLCDPEEQARIIRRFTSRKVAQVAEKSRRKAHSGKRPSWVSATSRASCSAGRSCLPIATFPCSGATSSRSSRPFIARRSIPWKSRRSSAPSRRCATSCCAICIPRPSGSAVSSIGHAIGLLGKKRLRSWVSLLLLASTAEDRPEDLLIGCVPRAFWCESMAARVGMKEREGDFFLLGLFSKIDALLARPLSDILAQLPVAEDVKRALAGGETPFSAVLREAESCEQDGWEYSAALAEALGVDRSSVTGDRRAKERAERVRALPI